jgi:transcriptional regulator with XRE-family HTH domain/tetratricopeptide (TPR) repeat protein
MADSYPPWTELAAVREAVATGHFGVLVRIARTAAGLTLEEAGRRIGYSAATLSRIERGRQQLTDVTLLRRLAVAFSIPPALFGLAETSEAHHSVVTEDVGRLSRRLAPGLRAEPVRRRDVLAGLTAMAAVQMGGSQSVVARTANNPVVDLVSNLEDLLVRGSRPADSRPMNGAMLRKGLEAVRADFQSSRYRALSSRLPRLVAAAELDTTPANAATIAEIYNTAAHVLIKVESRSLEWLAIDRALRAARTVEDPAALANVTRNLVTLYRRAERFDKAEKFALEAAETLSISDSKPNAQHLSLYGMLLCNAGYAAAQAGDRSRAAELLNYAAEAAELLGGDRNEYWTAFGPTNVTLHRISAAWALGDAGAAIDYATTVPQGAIRLPERQSRYWVDVARAWHQLGKFERSFHALVVAEKLAPEEVRSRPAARSLAEALLYAPKQSGMSGLRGLAARVGATS